nr:MAG TPA: Neck appendage protein [Caudoviricetes sp.]
MIYLTNGNTPLNAAYADKISQEANSTYQLTFRFPTSDALWEKLKEETFLTADDLHGEQDFVIFEVQKKHGYIQVYANQSFTLLNNYVINPISLDRATGSTALSRFAGSITRDNPFSFFSDIDERHTFNTDSVNAMAAFTKDKHSILGQWGGDLVRHGYQVRLLKNGGSENESLFMYKKNLSSYKQKTSTKSLKTRITFKTTVKGEGEKAPDRKFSVVVDSPLINKYSQIYEDVIEVNDQDVKDEAGLRKYGEQYFRTTLCDMLEDSLEIQVEGKSDVPVQIFDIVSLFHDRFKMDVRKKITKYTYSPMAKKLLSIGFGQFKSGLSNMLSNAVNDAVKNETQHLQGQFATQLAREIKNADLDFDRKKAELVNQFTDGLNAAKAKAEEVKKSLTETIDQRFRDFDSTGLNEIKQKADEALRNAGAGSLLAQEAKQISEQVRRQLDNKADLIEFQRVKETNKLYERIIGRNENDIADKVARIALTNQLFQVEIGKSVDIHENLYVASKSEKGFLTFEGGIAGADQRKKEIVSDLIAVTPKTNMIFQHWVTVPSNDPDGKAWFVWQFFDGYKKKVYERFSGENAYKIVSGKQHNVNLVTVPEKARFVKISARMYEDGLIKVERGTIASNYTQAPNDTLEAVRTVQTQLAGSWAIQNLTSAGSIISQINATNNQILIEAEKIRLKGKTLLDELTAIDGYFKRLFVGEGNFAKLNAEIIGSKTITADKLIMDQAMARMFVSSDIFTDTLAAKEAFINKLRSVVVTATLLEGYKGRIGGFQIGTHDKDPSYYWLTGQNSFDVGLSSGKGRYNQTSLWVNWGDNWNKPGNKAWFVKNTGEMYCYNTAHFWNNPKVYGNLEVTGDIVYRYEENGVIYLKGYWIYSPQYKRIEESNNYLYLYRNGSSYSWIPMNKEISDRRYKSNIQDSQVSGLDVIENLKTYSYRKEYDGKIEDISCGIMAQDVQKYVPEAFYENPDGAYSYRTFELVPYLIKAIQELNQKIQKLEKTDE